MWERGADLADTKTTELVKPNSQTPIGAAHSYRLRHLNHLPIITRLVSISVFFLGVQAWNVGPSDTILYKVQLSRLRSLEGLHLLQSITMEDLQFRPDERLLVEMERLKGLERETIAAWSRADQ